MTYAELQTAVINYFKRGDIAARIPAWVALAEGELFRSLDIPKTEIIATGTTSGGLIALPANFQTVSKLTVTIGGVEVSLDYINAPDDMASSGGYPDGYNIQGSSIRIYPNTGNSTAYKLYYIPKLVGLATAGTNWILDNAPDLYLYATALQGAAEMKNDGEIARITPVVVRLLESANSYSKRMGQPKRGGMQIKPRRAF